MDFYLNFLDQNFVNSAFFHFVPVLLEFTCLCIKVYIIQLLFQDVSSQNRNKTFFFLIAIICMGLFTNVTLILQRIGCPPFSLIPPVFFRSLCRLEMATLAIQSFVLLSFFRGLSSEKIKSTFLDAFYAISGVLSAVFVAYFVGWAGYSYLTADLSIAGFRRTLLDVTFTFYLLEGLVTLYIIYRNYINEKLTILKQHTYTLGFNFMLPYLMAKILESDFLAPRIEFSHSSMQVNFPASLFSSLWVTWMLYYCCRKLVGLRFLNISSHVQSTTGKYAFIDNFRRALVRLSAVSQLDELVPVTKDFFQVTFNVPVDCSTLIFRNPGSKNESSSGEVQDARRLLIEKAFTMQGEDREIAKFVHEHKIVIRDEVEFTQFYNQQNHLQHEDLQPVLDFLQQINADVFLPVYNDTRLVSYLIIERGARPNSLYNDVEREEMVVFCNYLGNVIYLLSNMNLETMMQRERTLLADVYAKDRRLALLKKSIFPFVGIGKTRKIGIITYQNKKFAYCNQAAKDLLKIDLNKEKGQGITRELSKLGNDAMLYLSPKRLLIENPVGERLAAAAAPNMLKNNSVISLANPTVADLVKDPLRSLKDQSKWDYLLPLMASEEGALVNQLIPANTPTLLNTKMLFFEYALTRKTMLLEMACEEDIASFAHVTHKINQRSVFEELVIKRSESDEGLMGKLFGVNPIFQPQQEPSLFEVLHRKGTLLLQNVHLLSMGIQKKLLEFILSGKFTPYNSDNAQEADILLICATTQNLQDFVQRGLFLKELYLALHKTAVWLPSLSTLPEDEFLELSEKLREQIVQSKIYQNLLVFTDYDKSKLLGSGCVSLYELKTKIHSLLLKKTKKQSLDDHAVIDPASRIVDLELVEAARLGKHALKDPKILAMLMKKFKNSQSKIALFLGVNRSTVSRRCAQYDIDGASKPRAIKEHNDGARSI